MKNRTLNKKLTHFNKERIILLCTFAIVIKMKCIFLILNGCRYYGVILVFSNYLILILLHQSTAKAVLRQVLTVASEYSTTSSVYCESGIETTAATVNAAKIVLLHQSTAKTVI